MYRGQNYWDLSIVSDDLTTVRISRFWVLKLWERSLVSAWHEGRTGRIFLFKVLGI